MTDEEVEFNRLFTVAKVKGHESTAVACTAQPYLTTSWSNPSSSAGLSPSLCLSLLSLSVLVTVQLYSS